MARRLAPSRAAARRIILAGLVTVEGVDDPKPSSRVPASAAIAVAHDALRFVSRGGDKLAGALSAFDLDVTGRCAVDVGASTGGFTDCLLQAGAAQVVAVDVGADQLHERLRADPRVTVCEQCDIRNFDDKRHGSFDVVVADVSFISLRTLAPVLAGLGGEAGDWIVLVKPQFEVGPDGRDGRGVVRDPAKRADAVAHTLSAFHDVGLRLAGFVPSVATGGAGNVEFVAWLRRSGVLAHVTGSGDHVDDD